MNPNMSVDTFSHMLSFLDIRSFESLQQTNQDNKNTADKFTHIYYESALMGKYGEHIITLLKLTDDNYRQNLKSYFHSYSLKTLTKSVEILEMFYNCIHQNKISTNHNLFIMIYDLCYELLSTNELSNYGTAKSVLKKHRDEFILKHYSEDDIKNKGLNYIMNATKHIDRWGDDGLTQNWQ